MLILFVFRIPLIPVIPFLPVHFYHKVFGREVRCHVNVKVNTIFLNFILFKPFDGEFFDEFSRSGNAV